MPPAWGHLASQHASSKKAKSSHANPIRPLSEMTGFETKKGLMLLYNPGPGDEWINRTIVKAPGGTEGCFDGGGAHQGTDQSIREFPSPPPGPQQGGEKSG